MPEERIGLALHSLNNLIRRYFEFSSHKKEIESITGNNGWIIGYLARHTERDVFQRDIEEHFNITRSTVSKVLSLMEQKDLIRRLSVAKDARLKKIVLTEKAVKLSEMMAEDLAGLEAMLLHGFQTAEVETLRSYLQRMKDNVSGAQ